MFNVGTVNARLSRIGFIELDRLNIKNSQLTSTYYKSDVQIVSQLSTHRYFREK